MEQIELVYVYLPDSEEMVDATPLGNNLYQVMISPLLSEFVSYGDVVEATLDLRGKLVARQVVSRGSFRGWEFAIPRAFVDSPELNAFCDAVMKTGGNWERIFGGLLIIHVPTDSPFDAEKELQFALRMFRLRDRNN